MEDARGREEEFPWYRYGGMWKVCFFFLFFWDGDGDGGRGLIVFFFLFFGSEIGMMYKW